MTILETPELQPENKGDYSIANFLSAVLIAVTVGQIGKSTSDMPIFFHSAYSGVSLSSSQVPYVAHLSANGSNDVINS